MIVFIHILNISGVITSMIAIVSLLLCCMNALPLSIRDKNYKTCKCHKCINHNNKLYLRLFINSRQASQ